MAHSKEQKITWPNENRCIKASGGDVPLKMLKGNIL